MAREDHTTVIQGGIDRLRVGDEAARAAPLDCAAGRLARLARKMLKGYPGVARWEQADDVAQDALIRFERALRAVTPPTARDFFRLADARVRRELIDRARHYQGRDGAGRPRVGPLGSEGSASPPGPPEPGTDTDDPARLAAWTEFHAQVQALPEADKEIFDLLWYQGLSRAEAAALLGVTERVVRYRWRSARVRLHHRLGGRLPG